MPDPEAGKPDPTLAQRLAGFAAGTRTFLPPEPVRADVPRRVLDTLGLCLAAIDLPSSQAVLRHVAAAGGAGQSRVIGLPGRYPAAQAAFANGVLAHSLDYDDTHLPSVLHPSASVVPAALAAAEAANAGGRDLVSAIAVGLEVCVRLGMAGYDRAAGNSLYFEHGQHATSICGTLGAAVAAGLVQGLPADRLVDALGIAASLAGGVLEGNRGGGTVKRLHCGFAARAGVLAAELAAGGVTGPASVLEGRFGFFQAFLHGRYDPAAVTAGLAEDWAGPGIFVKPYPANHFTHAGIDAAVALRERGLRPDQVAAITLGVPGPTVRTIGEPIERKRAPETGYEAQFSGPYTVAAALSGGHGLGLALADFTDPLARDPARRKLMSMVSVVADPECDAIYPDQLPAVLTVDTVDGRRLVERVLANRGGPDRPLSGDELATKFRDNAGRALPPGQVERLAQTVHRLGRLDDCNELLAPLAVRWPETEVG
jgi:2-methylcitrate dehydratase PrpD